MKNVLLIYDIWVFRDKKILQIWKILQIRKIISLFYMSRNSQNVVALMARSHQTQKWYRTE